MALSSDVLEFIALMNQEKIEYLVIGGWAVGFHGHPRYTKDLDILIRSSAENASKMLRVLDRFGFDTLDISEKDFLNLQQIVQLGIEPNRIDLLTSVPGVDFPSAYQKKCNIILDGVSIDYLSLEDLITNKTAAARPQDLADVSKLRKIWGK